MTAPLLDARFERPGLPPGWYTDTPYPRFENGAWNCQTRDGVIIPLPRADWRSLRVEADLDTVEAGASAYCGADGDTAFTLALGIPHPRHQAAVGAALLARSAVPAPCPDGRARLVFEWTPDRLRADANGTRLLDAPNPRGAVRCGALHLGFARCRVRHLALFAAPPATSGPDPIRPLSLGFPLEVTVDFNDDLMAAPWSPDTFDALFSELAAWGAKRVSWIDLGRPADGFFDFAPLRIAAHARESIRRNGDLFAAAVTHAHRAGLELVGILKPFDMAIHGFSWPPFSDQARRHGRIPVIGGSAYWATRLAQHNRHLVMARKPDAHGPALQPVWTRIDLVKDDDAPAPLSPGDITLWVSDDNDAWRPYTAPCRAVETVEAYPLYRSTPSGVRPTAETRTARVFRLEGLTIREPFVALRVNGSARSFENRLCDLVHVFGETGEETRLTYGFSPRRADHTAQFLESPGSAPASGSGDGTGGFEFDRYPGSPSSAWISGGDPIVTPLALDRGPGAWLALARGKDPGTLGALSPSFPETRALWMDWVRAMLDAGADGIDIRPGHHHAHVAWIEYGFEEPVRAEMLKRTGVDIWETDAFDHDLWRRIRGDGWTQFLREASAVVRARGKTLALHVDGYFDGSPGTGGGMNILADWRTWLDERLADRVTGKSLWPDSALAREVLARAHAGGIPVTYAPYCNNFFEDRRAAHPNHVGDSPDGCTVPVERLLDWSRRAGFDGFVFYECASALRARADGTVGFRRNAEPLRALLRRHFMGTTG